MKCPFCGRDYLTQEEVMSCIVKHTREYQEEQTKQSQRLNLMQAILQWLPWQPTHWPVMWWKDSAKFINFWRVLLKSQMF